MQFHGQVWFDFSSRSVWVFYQWLRALAAAGTEVALEWVPLPSELERAAMATLVGIEDPVERGRFLQVMLGRVHIDHQQVGSVSILDALAAAGLEAAQLREDHRLLADLTDRASELGVSEVPSLYRHGPVLSIQLNPAVLDGDVTRVAETIDAVMTNDGIWELRKP